MCLNWKVWIQSTNKIFWKRLIDFSTEDVFSFYQKVHLLHSIVLGISNKNIKLQVDATIWRKSKSNRTKICFSFVEIRKKKNFFRLSRRMLIFGLINFILSPFVFVWQLLNLFYGYAEVLRQRKKPMKNSFDLDYSTRTRFSWKSTLEQLRPIVFTALSWTWTLFGSTFESSLSTGD